MKHNLSHQQKILQKMALTPQMKLSIKLLGMSTKDINEYVDFAVESNPFLMKIINKKRAERYKSGLSPWNSDLPTDDTSGASYEYADTRDAQDEDPRTSLLSQLRMSGLKGRAVEIAEYLISEMDENGYIKVEAEEMANGLLVPVEEVRDCLALIQNLEPAGIGARDVRECLQLQLKRQGKEGSLEYIIVTEFINEIARDDLTKISKALDVDKEKIQHAVNNIKKLNPRPASTMLSKKGEPVIPDIVASAKDKKIRLELNRESVPCLRLYNPYENKLGIIKDSQTRKFMKENMDLARHLIDNLKRREETMCKVADYILNFQGREAINGNDEIKSLTIKDVSSALNLHPSTINRTVSNKYIQIDDRVAPLKSFLSHGIKKENGESTSKVAVKKKIEALVRNEDKTRPLSDKSIREKLAKEGIIIKRRTVAKYRTTLRLLPSYLRK